MNETVFLKRPDAEIGDRQEHRVELGLEPFDLHGRHHEVSSAAVEIAVTRLTDGIHLDLDFDVSVKTTCDRTLDDVTLAVGFTESEFIEKPDDDELAVVDWTFDPKLYAERAIPSEVPMQVFSEGSEPVGVEPEEKQIDARWKGLDDLFASGF
ncbi:YceD family protein [Rubrobacter indicoceani]|uniref:YceD family protein n=1 Tax=Rubrobacter indicoceani TaxID=2051957 RepID=UPI000E5A4BC2|nr:hypothetical protein [Rubrobacter indicoceani]